MIYWNQSLYADVQGERAQLALSVKQKIIVYIILWNSGIIRWLLSGFWPDDGVKGASGFKMNWTWIMNVHSERVHQCLSVCVPCFGMHMLIHEWNDFRVFYFSIPLFFYIFHKHVCDDCVFSLAEPLALILSFSMVCGPKAAALQLLMRFTY